MKRKNKHLILLVIISIVSLGIIIGLFNLFKRDIWDLNATNLKKQILSVEQGDEVITLSELTPFKWDNMYSFYPYTSKEKIYKTIGYKWDDITEAMSEGIVQIVFVSEGRVVCYLTGLPSNIKYDILLNQSEYKDGIAVLNSRDDLHFKISTRDGITYLEQAR